MSLDAWQKKSTEPDTIELEVTMVGNATITTTPTKGYGKGVTLNRTGVGVITLTLAENIGSFVGGAGKFSFQTAGTASTLAGWSVVFGAFDTAQKVVTVNIFNGSLAAADLLTGATLALQMPFKRVATAL
jgi:hypothetical protein